MLWVMFGQLWSWGLSILEITIVPRYLGASAYGKVGYVGTFMSFFSLFIVFGGPEQIIRVVAADPEKGRRIATAQLLMRLVLTVPLLSCVYLICRYVVPTDPGILALFPFTIAAAYFLRIYETLNAWRQGYQQFAVIARAQMIAQSIATPTRIGIVRYGGTPNAKMLGQPFADVIGNLLKIAAVWFQKGNPIRFARVGIADFKTMAVEGWPFFRYYVPLWFYGDATSILFISWIAGMSSTGCYNLALRLVGVVYFVPASIVQALLPTMTDGFVRAREEYDVLAPRFANMTIVLALPFALILILKSRTLLHVLHDDSFMQSAVLLQVYGIGLCLKWASISYGALLVASDRAGKRANAALWALPYNLIATPLLVFACHHAHGIRNGALGALIVAETTEIIIVGIYSQHFRGTGMIRQNLNAVGRGLLACAVPFLVLQLPMGNLAMFMAVGVASILLFLPAAVFTGALPRDDFQMLTSIFKRKVSR